MPCRLCWLVLCIIFLSDPSHAEHPLLVSLRLEESRFKDWTYGYKVDRRQINCVQFVAEVARELLQRELTPDELNAIYIKLPRKERNLERLIRKNDPRMRGIQSALTSMGKGTIIQPTDAAPGDFVQYWTKRGGRWRGHSAVIAQVENRNGQLCSVVFGSHQSLGGVGLSNFEVGLNDPDVIVYLVRFTP